MKQMMKKISYFFLQFYEVIMTSENQVEMPLKEQSLLKLLTEQSVIFSVNSLQKLNANWVDDLPKIFKNTLFIFRVLQ